MAPKQDGWTPYGLETIRIHHLRRRRIFSALLVFGLVGLWFVMFETTTTTQTELYANGQRVGSGIQIDLPDEKPEEKPVTVSISPGRVTRADTSQETGGESISRPNAPVVNRAAPYNWLAYLMLYGPFILIAAATYFLRRRPKNVDEVNFGIYKGAMPLELLTATARENVLTRNHARGSVFGKRRRDYLPRQVLLVERVEQEDDA